MSLHPAKGVGCPDSRDALDEAKGEVEQFSEVHIQSISQGFRGSQFEPSRSLEHRAPSDSAGLQSASKKLDMQARYRCS